MTSVLPKQPAKHDMYIVLPLLLLLYGGANIHCSTVHESSQDLRPLLDFKQGITSDPYGALSNWTMSSHFCRWNGIICRSKRRPLRVLSLALTGKSLSGQISSSIGNLTFLKYLDLSYNNFFGPLLILGGLQQLQDLYLNDNNFFSGSLPVLGGLQQLQYLFLNSNNLTGIIPDELTNCSNLNYLDTSSNSLVGSISPKFGLLSNLVFVSFASNHLEGSIPSELSQPRNLEYLILGGNRLSGEIPHSIFGLSSLKSLSLDYNMLDKASLPPNIGELLPNLIQLTLENNSFEGPIPTSLGSILGLKMLDLSLNNFSGQIPTSLGKLSNLTVLNLNNNQLVARDKQDWEFLNALRNCRSLTRLMLADNKLQGSIPEQIPQDIGKLTALTRLGLGDNYFSGTIEIWIEKLKSLQVLHLESNNFTGPIPSSISNLTQLIHLSLYKNQIQGPIPSSLGNLPHLLHLDLSYNNLQGYIPPNFGNLEQLILFDLSHNNLQGDITLDISELKQLTDLRLSSNKFSGEIPDTFGKCQQLETLLMDQNDLIGNIPLSIKGLQSLKSLNLSHNNLSGTIPTILEDLSLLNKLDLSYNHLQGEIPMNGVFANATAISLNDNWGLCGGAMDLHMPACSAVSQVIEWKHYLTILLILVFGFMSLGMSIYVIYPGKKAPRRPIVHCDLKPNNILLDDDMNAHLGDFGIASLVVDSKSIAIGHLSSCSNSLAVRGTIGYIAPEYAQTVHASTCGDVYSFGILLLEIIIGKRPTDSMFEGGLSITSFVERNFPDQVLHIIDPHLQEECKGFIKSTAVETENGVYRCVLSLVQVALACTRPLPRERMNMREVAINLNAIRKSYVAAIK
ncbi:unnamed protein product [Urochloa decumbens]|uniref:non-specific serine/threonine protein kinase n=1 Tax=Urochloa decumbens TaxID=240449 RepID=A0ABC9CIN7_9POAL